MTKPTEITITIDTECSIAGAFAQPDVRKPVADKAILCEVDGKEQGVGFLLDTFEQYNIKASFFVECAHYYYFGDKPMQAVVERILKAGQDAQLHVHPCWMYYNKDPELGTYPTNDSCKGRDYDELKRIFELSIGTFKRWTGKRPDALRTGSLLADLNIYDVLSDLEIPVSSNVAIGVNLPDEEELYLNGGRHYVKGVMELPVYSYVDRFVSGKEHVKSLQITSCSWPEMKFLLNKARAEGVENIVILTHPFEFIKKSDPYFTKITRNRVNQQRLEKLCMFIAENENDFISADFGSNHQKWLSRGPRQENLLEMPPYYAFGRRVHNLINDKLWYY